MSNFYRESDDTDRCRLKNLHENGSIEFVPSVQSVKNAHDFIREYEKMRLNFSQHCLEYPKKFEASPPVLDMNLPVDGNIIPLRSLVWTRPPQRLSRSYRYSPSYTLSSAYRARRVSLQRQALRATRYVMALAPLPTGSAASLIFDDVQSDALERLYVMAVQGLALVFGLSGLFLLLMLL